MVWLYIWLGVVITTLVVEFITTKLVSVWLSLGAVVAMILCAVGVGYEIQIITMLVLSLVGIFGLRKLAIKFFDHSDNKNNKKQSNAQKDDNGDDNSLIFQAIDNTKSVEKTKTAKETKSVGSKTAKTKPLGKNDRTKK